MKSAPPVATWFLDRGTVEEFQRALRGEDTLKPSTVRFLIDGLSGVKEGQSLGFKLKPREESDKIKRTLRRLAELSPQEGLIFTNEEEAELRSRFPDQFAVGADAQPLSEEYLDAMLAIVEARAREAH